jgi:putative acetyltransferase
MALKIRRYTVDDLPWLIDLFRRSVREAAVSDYAEAQLIAWAPDEIDSVAWGQKRLIKPTWVALLCGRIVGFVDLEPNGHIDMLYVHPEFTKRGVATALLVKAVNAARRQGNGRMHSEVSLTARRAFEKQGFQVIHTQVVSLRGQTMVNHVMERILT